MTNLKEAYGFLQPPVPWSEITKHEENVLTLYRKMADLQKAIEDEYEAITYLLTGKHEAN